MDKTEPKYKKGDKVYCFLIAGMPFERRIFHGEIVSCIKQIVSTTEITNTYIDGKHKKEVTTSKSMKTYHYYDINIDGIITPFAEGEVSRKKEECENRIAARMTRYR